MSMAIGAVATIDTEWKEYLAMGMPRWHQPSREHSCKKGWTEKVCQYCGKTYTPTNGRQQFCKDCRIAARTRRFAEYGVAHRIEKTQYDIKYRSAHSDSLAEYRATHPEIARQAHAKRRALKYGNTPIREMLTEAQWRDILDQYHHRCAYCGRKMEKLTIDHVVPLSKGGKHSANNVVPACQHCNSTKNARTPEQWVGIGV